MKELKKYTVYWRFKGNKDKRFLLMPCLQTSVKAMTKKEAAKTVKESLENVKIIRID